MKQNTLESIDFVLPWVDSGDAAWQKERDRYDTDYNGEDRDNATRFRDTNTLKYVLRSIEKHCPWYHKIYLITTGHYPEWLDIDHPKIELVTHKELFIDEDALPVFNSNAIEMNLVNIKELSDAFVYLNDDMIVWNPLEVERFFQEGLPVDFFYHGWVPRNRLFQYLRGKDLWLDALNSNLTLINREFKKPVLDNRYYYHSSYKISYKISNFLYRNIYKKVFWIDHWHHPQPYLKKTLEEVYSVYKKEMIDTSTHKFRSKKDITPYLYRYWHLMKGEFAPYAYHDDYVARITSLKSLEEDISIIKQDKTINFVCFNDQMNHISQNEFYQVVLVLENYLEEVFPEKATFETL